MLRRNENICISSVKHRLHANKEIVICILFQCAYLIPLIMVGKYNVASADDFLMLGVSYHDMLNGSANLLDILQLILRRTINGWLTWQGTYSYYILNGLASLLGLSIENGYALVAPISLGLFHLGVFCIVHFILRVQMGMALKNVVIIYTLISSVCVQLVPRPVEAFFWFNGSSLYSGIFSVALIAIASFGNLIKRKSKPRLANILITSVLILFVAGGNYPTALVFTLIIVTWTAILLVRRSRGTSPDSNYILGIVLATILCIGIIFNISAPGNQIRLATEGIPRTWSVLHSIKLCFILGFQFFRDWISISLLLVLFALGYFAYRGLQHTRFVFSCPFLWTVFSVCVFCASFAPTAHSYGWIGPMRYMNVVFYMYIFMLSSNVIYYAGYFAHKKEVIEKYRNNGMNECISKENYRIIGLFLALVSLLICIENGSDFYINNEENQAKAKYTSIQAIKELKMEIPQNYYAYYENRWKTIKESEEKHITVEPCPEWCKSTLLYFDDITHDEQDWRNQLYADYFGKESIVLN